MAKTGLSRDKAARLRESQPEKDDKNRQFTTHVNEQKNNQPDEKIRETDIQAYRSTIKALEITNEQLQATTEKLKSANQNARQLNDDLQSKNTALSAEIAKRKQAEGQLIKAKRAADAANKAKTDFLAGMSHELRTPMNAVLGFAQMLQFNPKSPLSPTQNDYVESILTGGHHLLALINDVLDLAVVEANRLNVLLEDVDAGQVVKECAVMTS